MSCVLCTVCVHARLLFMCAKGGRGDTRWMANKAWRYIFPLSPRLRLRRSLGENTPRDKTRTTFHSAYTVTEKPRPFLKRIRFVITVGIYSFYNFFLLLLLLFQEKKIISLVYPVYSFFFFLFFFFFVIFLLSLTIQHL